MTRASLYHYARVKDALLTACGDIARQQLIEALGLSRGEPDGRARLAAFFRRYAEIVSEDFGRCFVLTDFSEMAEDEREKTRKAPLAAGQAGPVKHGRACWRERVGQLVWISEGGAAFNNK